MQHDITTFVNLVWPVVRQHLGNGDILPIEGSRAKLAKQLDRQAGIDFLQLCPDGGIRGIAARVQRCDWPYETFTVRLKSELPKRLRDLSNGYLTASHTIQAYICGDLIVAGVIETTELYRAIKQLHNQNKLTVQTNGIDGNKFVVARWNDLPQGEYLQGRILHKA